MKVNQFLFSRIDNSPLVVFRVFFGLLIMLEAWGAIATGWVKRIFVDPEFTFNFIGFDFLKPQLESEPLLVVRRYLLFHP